MIRTLSTIVLAALCAAVLALTGCAGVRTNAKRDILIASRTGPVCLLAGGLPDGVQSTYIGEIHATKGSYGGSDQLMTPIANEARAIGADAVINLQTAQKFKGPLPWRVTAPTGKGSAVKVNTPFDCAASGGHAA